MRNSPEGGPKSTHHPAEFRSQGRVVGSLHLTQEPTQQDLDEYSGRIKLAPLMDNLEPKLFLI